ncbi:MAG TPA: alpha/beta fold hydrolase [Solirubrobacterales bacterium]|nr:alpha/beta fold hydrolase [Solirubrobacterales bacterium]
MAALDPRGLAIERNGRTIRGEAVGEGTPVVLLHGLTATHRYVVHGSNRLARAGHLQLSYDARGHGRSDAAPEGEGYAYPALVADLEAVTDAELGERRFVLAGHSMGAHTAIAYALDNVDRLAGLALISPVFAGFVDEAALERWDRLADGLESGGVDGFMAAFDRGLDPSWRDTVIRFTRRRMLEHRHPQAVARALREVPRSAPFDAMSELEFLDLPALVVASRDVADPGHPYAVAAAYADRLPAARLISEAEGESPLPWQGGRLAREIEAFCAEPPVAARV